MLFRSHVSRPTIVLSGNDDSEPTICNTSPISWQVFETVEPVDAIDRNLCHILRFRESQVDRDETPTLRAKVRFSPICHAPTCGAEMKRCLARYVGLRRAGDIDSLAFKAIGPKHTVAATYRATAGRGRLRNRFEAPSNGTAVARTLNHVSHPSSWAAVSLADPTA